MHWWVTRDLGRKEWMQRVKGGLAAVEVGVAGRWRRVATQRFAA